MTADGRDLEWIEQTSSGAKRYDTVRASSTQNRSGIMRTAQRGTLALGSSITVSSARYVSANMLVIGSGFCFSVVCLTLG
jgi:hypothetical protein